MMKKNYQEIIISRKKIDEVLKLIYKAHQMNLSS